MVQTATAHFVTHTVHIMYYNVYNVRCYVLVSAVFVFSE